MLRFGTAGIPGSTEPRNTANGVIHARELGLDAMEMEFVQSVNVKKEKAPEIKKVAKKNDISLSCHASYFINLAALEPQKRGASRGRLIKAGEILDLCGGKSVVVHAGFYLKRDPAKVHPLIIEGLKKVDKLLTDNGHKVTLRPETMGKHTQWGTLDEIIKASEELEHVLPCIDISHMHALTNGGYNSTKEYNEIFEKVEEHLGKRALKDMHFHAQGIEYTEKGERFHRMIDDSDFKWKEFLKVLKDWKISGTLICESPDPEADVLKMQKYYSKL